MRAVSTNLLICYKKRSYVRDAGKIGTESMQQLDDLEVPVGRGHRHRSEPVLRTTP
jgi:hypothetical protein